MIKHLPSPSSVVDLKNQAEQLLHDWKAGDPAAIQRISLFNFSKGKEPALDRAQLIVAREYGVVSWAKLKSIVETSFGSREEAAGRLIEVMRADFPEPGKRRAIEAILAQHSDLDAFDLSLACIFGNVEHVRRDLRRNPGRVNDKIGVAHCEPLLYCTFSWFLKHDEIRRAGIRGVVKLLLTEGANPNVAIQTPDGSLSALYGAAGAANDLETVRMLLDAGANPNDGESCYHAAEYAGHEVLKLLFAKGVDETQRSHAIFRKLDFDDLETVVWLLDHGVSPNQRWAADGSTPLMQALNRNRSLPFFRVLLDRGADPNLTDDAGQTPFQLAAILGRKDVSDLLIARGANSELGTFETWAAASLAGERPAQVPDFSILGRSQRDLLCQLAGNGQTVEVSALLNAGFPIDLGLWATPLHNACWNGRLETVKMLISQGAPLEATEPTYHSTPLGWTMHGSVNRKGGPPEAYVAIVEALIDAGARMPSAEEEYWQEEGSASPEIREWLLARV